MTNKKDERTIQNPVKQNHKLEDKPNHTITSETPENETRLMEEERRRMDEEKRRKDEEQEPVAENTEVTDETEQEDPAEQTDMNRTRTDKKTEIY
ncbi:MAG: hypothetical protein ACKVPJ_07795 [Chitinophagales bacterium]